METTWVPIKAELGKYLRYIPQGEEVIVMDRKQPLARVLPFKPISSRLILEEAQEESKNLNKLHFSSIRNKKIDSLSFLMKERGDK